MDAKERKVQLSMLFNWYSSDFGGKKGVLEFLAQHTKGQSQEALQSLQKGCAVDDIKFGYNDYDWSMNSV